MKPSTAGLLLAMLPVRNEARRYLEPVLNRLAKHVDGIVILDDASTDETPDICRSNPRVIEYRRLPEPLFNTNEAELRRILWEMTVRHNPAWICALDADEVFESGIGAELPRLTGRDRYDLIYFPVYHFWGSLSYYRVDGLWDPVLMKTPCLCRYRKNNNYHWPDRKLHCGRFPLECYRSPGLVSKIRLLHLGYVNQAEHQAKLQRYLALDPEGKYCPIAHYRSIMAVPQLKPWTGERMCEFS